MPELWPTARTCNSRTSTPVTLTEHSCVRRWLWAMFLDSNSFFPSPHTEKMAGVQQNVAVSLIATVVLKRAACLSRRYLTLAYAGELGGCIPSPFVERVRWTLIGSLLFPVVPSFVNGHSPLLTSNSGISARYVT